ncbi:hypothetical protein LUZ63_024075 [Rhynchospora breviuscula]|uniref:Uncharacterized protein n=1 Tax=Rhynchospora breviuscula TaxID=2022672 RepID=A0A9Q0BWI1_9POAL|nr:hypothetical protein LUZ63_024075 [Rhynchospora breviuscula]
MLNLYDADGKIQFDADKRAAREYFLQHVNQNTVFFHSPQGASRLPGREGVLRAHRTREVLDGVHPGAQRPRVRREVPFRDLPRRLQVLHELHVEDLRRQALPRAFRGPRRHDRPRPRGRRPAPGRAARRRDSSRAASSPRPPTFLNAGKAQRGELVSCFLLRIEDNMESIARGINSALQLSKRGGGVALLLSNIRESGAPIKQIENQSSGIIPVMKLLEDSFSYANQLGARQGAGAVYLNAHHPDILRFLDTKRENADEKIRIKTLSLGVVIPDITFELAKNGEDMYLFSPYDVEKVYKKPFGDISVTEKYREMVDDPRIKKTKINAREFFQTLAEIQFESGYPYIMFEDTVNKANPIAGRINMSNLCSEILQVNTPTTYNEDLSYDTIGKDISCNLGSMNIALAMDGGDLGLTVETAIRALTAVSVQSHIASVRSIEDGNDRSHAIGLGQMNLHGYLAREHVHYGSEEGIDFTNIYFYTVLFHALRPRTASRSSAARPSTASRTPPTPRASSSTSTPTRRGSRRPPRRRSSSPACRSRRRTIGASSRHQSSSTASTTRTAGRPADRIDLVHQQLHELDPPDRLEDRDPQGGQARSRVLPGAVHGRTSTWSTTRMPTRSAMRRSSTRMPPATQHVDQGLSLTLFFKDTVTTRDINKAQIYAWKKGIKTIYYIRLRQLALEGTDMTECVSCML